MNDLIKKMLPSPLPEHSGDVVVALREIMQSVALLGLWRAKFFNEAAFYGGTALRILYGLNRFSEDLDFSMLKPIGGFNFSRYKNALENEFKTFGFDVSFEPRQKTENTVIESAFLKTKTYRQLLVIDTPKELLTGIHPQSTLKIKLEVDTNPPTGFDTEMKYVFSPLQFAVRSYTLPSLFAGKLHAVLCRKWKNRVKGRDWYDFAWYVSKHPKVNIVHLEQRMRDSGHYRLSVRLTPVKMIELLDSAIDHLDVTKAKDEVAPFVTDFRMLEIWSKDFFRAATRQIIFV
ncbi:MAG: nucleotidyl transferase AbiEii/AbiGii toxin family protein [Bacteroidales bacterium]|nr:nucleotidyl transferase AbiEii/AbiGii toxin family protein [Bacteroidales bacterium]